MSHSHLQLVRVTDEATANQVLTDVYQLGTLFSMKDVGFRIRVDQALREQFIEAYRRQDKPAAQVLREFMRAFVNENANANERANRLAKKALEA